VSTKLFISSTILLILEKNHIFGILVYLIYLIIVIVFFLITKSCKNHMIRKIFTLNSNENQKPIKI